MEFRQFAKVISEHIAKITKGKTRVFTTGVDKDKLWELYLDSFPKGKNEVYLKRREYDCSNCRAFVRKFGDVVVIENNKLISVWDVEVEDETFKPVVEALSKYVKSVPVNDIFLTSERQIGVEWNAALDKNNQTTKWYHLNTKVPAILFCPGEAIAKRMAEVRDVRNVFFRSLVEITEDAVSTVLELIAQNSLYRGEEWEAQLEKFQKIQKEFKKVKMDEKENYVWTKSIEVGPVIGKIRNHSIGVLLQNISEGMDLDEAVRKYESIVAPSNYKRPKAIFTQKMLKEAENTVKELGYEDSLGRRLAVLEDITVNNILFANRDISKRIAGSVFDEMKEETNFSPKSLQKIEEVEIDTFINEILPKVSNIEVLFEQKHVGNLVSLIAPKVRDSKTMFKWDNNFCWAYNGNIADSMKQRVKEAGGRVDGDLRFSISWNENKDNEDDLDAHCREPNGSHIFFGTRGRTHPSSGMLDVDIIHPNGTHAVENIIYTDKKKMPKGLYRFIVHCYCSRGAKSGFDAEVEFDGQIFKFSHQRPLRQEQEVVVAEVEFDGKNFNMKKSMDSKMSNKTVWNIKTNQFIPVYVLMHSPNYWDEQKGIGNKHLFFMLKDCKNEGTPNGFFNEYLNETLMKHKQVFEALGSKMRVEEVDDQLSGIGFSSTQRNELVVKVSGSFSRMLKIKF